MLMKNRPGTRQAAANGFSGSMSVACRFALLFFLLASTLPSGSATSVRPPDFSELVEKAESIIRGEVIAVRSEWKGAGETRRIVTLVTIRIDRTLVGQLGNGRIIELEFLGGRVGTESLEVSGMPSFTVGSRDLLFVEKNGRQLCPLVGFSHGRYLIVPSKDGSPQAATIARNNRVPLESTDEVVLPLHSGPSAETLAAMKQTPMTLSAFELAVTTRARELGRQDVAAESVQQ